MARPARHGCVARMSEQIPETPIQREARILALIDIVVVDASDKPLELAILNALKGLPEDEPIRAFAPRISDR